MSDLKGEQGQDGEDCPPLMNKRAGSMAWKTAGRSSRAKHCEGEDGLDERDLER